MIYRFDDFELDTDRLELRRDGAVQSAEPQTLDLISFFCANPDRLVSREELMRAIWGDRIVADATISTSIKFARRALGDSGDRQAYIRTVRGRGFRFVGPVERRGEPGAPPPGRPRARDVTLAVLPLAVLSQSPELRFFADGFVEDVTTLLARMSEITVISCSSTFRYRGRRPGVSRVREELGASHLVMGSVRPLGAATRINVQLVETAGGDHLWAERFDRPAESLFELQDDVILAVCRLLEPQLARASWNLLEPRPYSDDAWDCYRRAEGLLTLRGWHGDAFHDAEALLRRAVELDPRSARAFALLALVLSFGQRVGIAADRGRAIEEATTAANAALALDDSDPAVLGNAGCALVDAGEPRRGVRLLERAVELDPSNAQAWAALGAAKVDLDRVAEGVRDLRHGMRISPLDNRLSVWGTLLAQALARAGEAHGALDEADAAARRDPANHMCHVVRAAILCSEERPEEAREAMLEARGLRPRLTRAEVLCLLGREGFSALDRAALLTDLAPLGEVHEQSVI